MAEPTRGEVFTTLVEAVLAEERELALSLVQRAANLIAASGVLVAVSLGLGTLVARTPPAGVPTAAVGCVAVAVLLLLGSALLALVVNAPWRQDAVDLDAIRQRAFGPGGWSAEDGSRREVCALRLDLAVAVRAANQRRARLLTAGFALEVTALAALSAAAVLTALPAL